MKEPNLKKWKRIPLTQGEFAIVDAEDFDYLNRWKWYTHKQKHSGIYAVRNKPGKKRQMLFMHREVMKAPKGGPMVDHINHNGLDNRKGNLRFASPTLNQLNRKSAKNNPHGIAGVTRLKNRWLARINFEGRAYHLGHFKSKTDAINARKKALEDAIKAFSKKSN